MRKTQPWKDIPLVLDGDSDWAISSALDTLQHSLTHVLTMPDNDITKAVTIDILENNIRYIRRKQKRLEKRHE